MAESGQIFQTTTDDLNRVAQLIAGNSVSNMRLEQTRINLRILKNQKRLNDLRAHENTLKARIYNNVDQAEIQANLAAGQGTQAIPLQAYRFGPITPNPNHEIATAKFKAYSSMYGVSQLDSSINESNSLIMALQAQIRNDKNALTQLQDAINTATQNQPTNYQETSIGKALPPSTADMQKDKLAKARIADLLYLQQLSVLYLGYSTNTNLTNLISGTGASQRGFPDEAKLPQTLISIRKKFWAVGQRFQDNTGSITDINFVEGTDALNFDDPGSKANQIILDGWVSVLRDVGENSKITPDVSDFINDNKSIINNSAVSENIERRPDPTLPASSSMNVQTQSYPATALSLGSFGVIYVGSYSISNTTDMVKKWYKKRQEQYIPLPRCPNVAITPATQTEQNEKNAQQLNQSVIEAGQQAFSTALKKAKAFRQKRPENSVTPLPDGAPDWAVQFNNLYGSSAYVGQISYPIIAIGAIGLPQFPATVTKTSGSDPSYGITLASTSNAFSDTTQASLTPPKYRLDQYTLGVYMYQLWSDTTYSKTQ
jgi:predicted  nucleic acid-binding Zn-ribbon protein